VAATRIDADVAMPKATRHKNSRIVRWRGEEWTYAELAKHFGFSMNTMRARLGRVLSSGADHQAFLDSMPPGRAKGVDAHAKRYLVSGEMLTAREISARMGVSLVPVYERIRKAKATGVSVADVLALPWQNKKGADVEVRCAHCDSALVVPHNKSGQSAHYCDKSCYAASADSRSRVVQCAFCKKELKLQLGRLNVSSNYCNKRCRGDAMRLASKKACEVCSNEFEVTPYQIKKGFGRFCSNKCACLGRRGRGKGFEFHGVRVSLSEMCEVSGLARKSLEHRLAKGMSVFDAMTSAAMPGMGKRKLSNRTART
jgi:hypothetical protein